MENVNYLLEGARSFGIEPSFEPLTNVVVLDIKEPESVYQKLQHEGFWASVSREPLGLRLVIMPHLTKPQIDLFLSALARVVD